MIYIDLHSFIFPQIMILITEKAYFAFWRFSFYTSSHKMTGKKTFKYYLKTRQVIFNVFENCQAITLGLFI